LVGADAGLPLAQLETFSINLYADMGKVAYKYDELHPSLIGTGVTANKIEFLKGLGTAVGLNGSIASRVEYRAEYRYTVDYYEPGIIDFNWENRRLTYQRELLSLILEQQSSTYTSSESTGFFVSGNLQFFNNKLQTGLGFGNYKKSTGTGRTTIREAEAFVRLEEDLVPRTWGDFIYRKRGDVGAILNKLIEEGTLLETNIYYRAADNLILSFNVKRTYRFDDLTNSNKPVESIGFSTTLSF
jgi:hypothetical protein